MRLLKGSVLKAQFKFAIPLFQTNRKPGLNPDGTQAHDMVYGDQTKKQIFALSPIFSGLDEGEFSQRHIDHHFANMRRFFSVTAWGSISDVASNMIDKFKESSGGTFTSATLTKKIREHDNTQAFIKSVRTRFGQYMLETYRNEWVPGYLRSEMQKYVMNELRLPKFDKFSDNVTGLGITVHDIWSATVELISYDVVGNHYIAVVKFTLYDHFGLDDNDVSSSGGKSFNILNCFRSWYILQHYNQFAYKPFLTKIEFRESFTGLLHPYF